MESLLKSLGIFTAAIFFAGGLVADDAKIITTLKIHQSIPNTIKIDIGDKGESHGDLLVFHAKLTSSIGLSGDLTGTLITTKIPNTKTKTHQDRIGQLVFYFGEANTLVVLGKAIYLHEGDGEMNKNEPQIRAIIGGTGLYIGSRGQVQTNRNKDGSYEHLIQLLK